MNFNLKFLHVLNKQPIVAINYPKTKKSPLNETSFILSTARDHRNLKVWKSHLAID